MPTVRPQRRAVCSSTMPVDLVVMQLRLFEISLRYQSMSAGCITARSKHHGPRDGLVYTLITRGALLCIKHAIESC